MSILSAMSDDYMRTDEVLAIADLVGRTGAQQFQFGFLHDDVPIDQAGWWAHADYGNGVRIMVDGGVSPQDAAERLAGRILNGSNCQGCGKVSMVKGARFVPTGGKMVHGISAEYTAAITPERIDREGLCTWERVGQKWQRACGVQAPDGSTREKLAQELIRLGVVHSEMIGAARAGRYDDYLSDTAFPQHLLISDLRQYGPTAQPLIDAVIAGDFDATKEESDAWARSPEGKATLAELVTVNGLNRAQRRAQKKKKR